MEVVENLKEMELKHRLLNCLLISRHFMLVLENKAPDFVDYSSSKKSTE
jgi:hypothetical protein